MAEFEAKDPDFEARVRSSFERQGIMGHIGATLDDVAPGYCEIRLGYGPELSQQHGYFHGGIIGTIADSAAGYAGYSLMPADSTPSKLSWISLALAPAATMKSPG